MSERDTISQVNQIGVETTPGTAVAANKRLTALSVGPAIQTDISKFRPAGYKFSTLAVPNKEWVEASLEGAPTYTEMIYPLASVLTNPTVAEILDGATPTGAYRWQFSPSSTSPDSPKTFTVEQGSSVRAQRFAYGLIPELTIGIGRDELSLGGSMLGTRVEDGITLTAAPTEVALIPILPTEIDIYVDTTSAGLGTTKLTRALSAELSLSNRYGPLWVLDSTKDSWVAHVELEPTAQLTLMLEADAQGMGLLTAMRAGATRFVRILATGDNIYDGVIDVDYKFQADLAVKVEDVGDYSDQDGVYAIEWTFSLNHDSGWGKALFIELINEIAAL